MTYSIFNKLRFAFFFCHLFILSPPMQAADGADALREEIAALRAEKNALVKQVKEADTIIRQQQAALAKVNKQKKQAQEALLANAPAAERMKALAIASRQTGSRPKELGEYETTEGLTLDEKPKNPWKFKVELGGSYSAGNTRSGLASLAAEVKRKTDIDELTFSLNGRLGENDGEQNAQQAGFNSRYQRNITENFYWYIDNKLFHDRFAGIVYRDIFNPGIGYKVINTDKVELAFEGGPSLLIQQLEDEPLITHPSARVAQTFKWKIYPHLHFFQEASYNYDFIETDNWVLSLKAGIENKIMKNLALRLTVEDMYNNNPSPGREKNNFLITTSLVFDTE